MRRSERFYPSLSLNPAAPIRAAKIWDRITTEVLMQGQARVRRVNIWRRRLFQLGAVAVVGARVVGLAVGLAVVLAVAAIALAVGEEHLGRMHMMPPRRVRLPRCKARDTRVRESGRDGIWMPRDMRGQARTSWASQERQMRCFSSA